jgi:hypothetical protein
MEREEIEMNTISRLSVLSGALTIVFLAVAVEHFVPGAVTTILSSPAVGPVSFFVLLALNWHIGGLINKSKQEENTP